MPIFIEIFAILLRPSALLRDFRFTGGVVSIVAVCWTAEGLNAPRHTVHLVLLMYLIGLSHCSDKCCNTMDIIVVSCVGIES